MANDLTSNPWTLDTANAAVIYKYPIKINFMEYDQYTNDTDTATVKDQTGKVVWVANGASDLSTIRTGKVGWINGLILSQITVGVLRIFFE